MIKNHLKGKIPDLLNQKDNQVFIDWLGGGHDRQLAREREANANSNGALSVAARNLQGVPEDASTAYKALDGDGNPAPKELLEAMSIHAETTANSMKELAVSIKEAAVAYETLMDVELKRKRELFAVEVENKIKMAKADVECKLMVADAEAKAVLKVAEAKSKVFSPVQLPADLDERAPSMEPALGNAISRSASPLDMQPQHAQPSDDTETEGEDNDNENDPRTDDKDGYLFTDEEWEALSTAQKLSYYQVRGATAEFDFFFAGGSNQKSNARNQVRNVLKSANHLMLLYS